MEKRSLFRTMVYFLVVLLAPLVASIDRPESASAGAPTKRDAAAATSDEAETDAALGLLDEHIQSSLEREAGVLETHLRPEDNDAKALIQKLEEIETEDQLKRVPQDVIETDKAESLRTQ